jgi:ADP-heptose:LPS heptosyltransferase
MLIGIKKKPKPVSRSLRDYYNKRNKVLLIYNARGIGDILNCRMLFRNFKKLMPDLHLTFACFKEYQELVKGHPCLDEVITTKFEKNDYMASYDISTCCIHYESVQMGKNTKHRAEIWADYCGIPLQDYDMDLPIISNEKITDGYLALKQLRSMSTRQYHKDNPSVLFSPLAFESMRSLTLEQMKGTLKILRDRGLFVYTTHNTPLSIYEDMNVPTLIGRSLSDWMSYVHAADYVVTVDTANFHYAGGLKKPMTGIFTHVDGKLRGKYYDFILVQHHRDNGNWPCGPCYNYLYCTHKDCKNPQSQTNLRPCLTEITTEMIEEGINAMLKKWPLQSSND